MLCHNCGNDVPIGHRTCASCGAADSAIPAIEAPAAFTIVEQTGILEPQRHEWAKPEDASPRTPDGHDDTPAATGAARPDGDAASRLGSTVSPGSRPNARSGSGTGSGFGAGSRMLAVVAGVAGLATIGGSFMPVSTITSDAPIPEYLGNYALNDLGGGTNFQVAFIVAGVLMLLGAVMVSQARVGERNRFGPGLIGGAALALAPFVGFMWAGAIRIADRALIQAEAIASAGGGGQIFESRLGAGFFVLIGSGGLGLIAFAITLTRAGNDGREPLGTALSVGGAIACVAAAAGQLLPERGFQFFDNFTNDFNSAHSVYSRIAMIAVMAIGGIIGFLLASRFGLGLAIGAVSLYVWQWVSSVFASGDYPAPPALGNPGGVGSEPHIVTTVGVIGVILAGCLSCLLAQRADVPKYRQRMP